MKNIKGERPSAVQIAKNDKAKSPVSSPTILSPKNKQKIIRPMSPKDNDGKKLTISAVVPANNSTGAKSGNLGISSVNQRETSKPINKLAISSVSRKEGEFIHLSPGVQVPKSN